MRLRTILFSATVSLLSYGANAAPPVGADLMAPLSTARI